MTIIVGLAPGNKGHAALHLAAVLARSRVEALLVCTIVKAPWPPDPNQSDREYLAYQEQQAQTSVEHARSYLGDGPLDVKYVVRRASSVAAGLLELTLEQPSSMVVLGSSSAGSLGNVNLGGVAERILHGAGVPVAVAPRGYRDGPVTELARMSVAFGRADHDSSLLVRAARAAGDFATSMRVVCFAVRPMVAANQATPPGAEQVVVDQWQQRIERDVAAVASGLDPAERQAGGSRLLERVEVVLGQGTSWDAALRDVDWAAGDVLVVGTSSGPFSRFFLGSHASKIVRNSPVPVILVPRG